MSFDDSSDEDHKAYHADDDSTYEHHAYDNCAKGGDQGEDCDGG